MMNIQENQWLRFGTSVFTTMSQKANKYGAINLAQGFPNFDGPEEIKKAACEAILSGKNQYAPAAGIFKLRELLAVRQLQRSGINYSAETETTVFSGATEALFVAISAFLKPGDELVAFAPQYDCYLPAVTAAGATMNVVALKLGTWSFDESELEAAITSRTRVILVNTPHNPTGKVFTEAELQVIAKIALKNDLIVITDEVYEELVFADLEVAKDQHKHHFLAALPGMRERTICISSTSKTFSMTGWKIGYAFAPENLSNVLRSLHQFTVFCSATPLQWAMVAGLQLAEDYYDQFRRDYLQRRNIMVEILRDAGFIVSPPAGSYFIMANYQNLSDLGNMEFADWLIKEKGVATIPIAPFYQAAPKSWNAAQYPYVRVAFCKDLNTLEQARKHLV